MSVSYSYAITSLSEKAASAQELLALQRGHWQVWGAPTTIAATSRWERTAAAFAPVTARPTPRR